MRGASSVNVAVTSVRVRHGDDGGQLWGWRRAESLNVPAGANARVSASASRTRALLLAAADALTHLPDPAPGETRDVLVFSDRVMVKETVIALPEAFGRGGNGDIRGELALLVRRHGPELGAWEPTG